MNAELFILSDRGWIGINSSKAYQRHACMVEFIAAAKLWQFLN